VSEAEGTAPEEWRRTSPLSFAVSAILSLRSAGLPALAALIGTGAARQGWTVIVPVLLAMGLLTALISFLAWRRFRYRIGETDIRVERGLFSRTARSVPYERIQDVSLEQALVPRLFGMVEVKFETGAGGKDEVRVRYVSSDEAEALRETVRARISGAAAGTAEPSAAEETAAALFVMDRKRLAMFGLFEFSLVAFAVLAGAAQQFDSLLPIDIWSYQAWVGLLGERGHSLQGAGLAAQVIAATLAIATLSLVGLATGFIRTVLRDYGFRLEDTPKGLRRRRGLLTRTDVIMPLPRIQALKLRTGIVRRRFGWHELGVVSLAQDAKEANHIIVPFGKMDEIDAVVAATGFALPTADTAWRRPCLRYQIDRALLLLVPPCFAALAVTSGGQRLGLGSQAMLPAVGALLALAALIFVSARFRWRHDRYAVEGVRIYVRRGWLAPRLDIASAIRLQSVEIVQGPLARRRSYANLRFGLAGGTLEIVGATLEDARAIRADVLSHIARVDFSHS